MPLADKLEFEPRIAPGSRIARGKQPDDELHLTFDAKVSPSCKQRNDNDYWYATLPNSFGLPAGVTCPGATDFCSGCYGVNSEKSKGVWELLNHNLQLLQQTDVPGMGRLIVDMLDRYQANNDYYDVAERDRLFRIHWDGDFFSNEYAQAWRNALQQERFSGVRFWLYTRSFGLETTDVVPILYGLGNLQCYLSVDEGNFGRAIDTKRQYPDTLMAYCAPTVEWGKDLRNRAEDRLGKHAVGKTVVCPVDTGRLALVNQHGKGACSTCNLCPNGTTGVVFSVEKGPPDVGTCKFPPCHNLYRGSPTGAKTDYCCSRCRSDERNRSAKASRVHIGQQR